MKLKVRNVGNSMGVILPKEILAKLHIQSGDELIATESPNGILLTPYAVDFEKQIEAAQEGMAQYRNTLRELAK